MKASSLMQAHIEFRTEDREEYAWVDLVLDTSGDLIRFRSIFNMTTIISDAGLGPIKALLENDTVSNVRLGSEHLH